MKISWDRDADAAYISLLEDEERVYGVACQQVTLERLAEKKGVDALSPLLR